jgi:hypothetical protein
MMTPSGIATWLEGQGVTPDMFVTDGEIPPAPDRLVIIQMTGGPGESRERTFDALSASRSGFAASSMWRMTRARWRGRWTTCCWVRIRR